MSNNLANGTLSLVNLSINAIKLEYLLKESQAANRTGSNETKTPKNNEIRSEEEKAVETVESNGIVL